MNAVEIEDAVSRLFEQPFDSSEYPYLFLEAYGNKNATIKRLRTGNNNRTDVPGAVLQHNNIHIAVAEKNKVEEKLEELRISPSTQKQKAKFILATDGKSIAVESINGDMQPIACAYLDFPNHFGYLLPIAGITTVKQISDNSFDIRATSRLNKLYVELLSLNPDWSLPERRQEMNHFMARLIFCFFAEDTDIFTQMNYMGNHSASNHESIFTNTVDEMSERDGSNTHEVIEQIFRTMDIKIEDRDKSNIPRYSRNFPYVNGQLFSGNIEVPRFNKIARAYLIRIGGLDWTQVNPDIFGSMIQAVTEDEERGALGMHYTSVPNILKVLNPLFLDSLHDQLSQAGDSPVKLLNLRKRIAKIRVFDPACGSGNFLIIAYKEMREIEAEINRRRKETHRRTDIKLTNFRGIEIRHFSAEIARLALIIAEYQCDVMYRGQQEALADLLPLSKENWITRGNALRIDWTESSYPEKASSELYANDLFRTPISKSSIDTDIENSETYVCGNPPYLGSQDQTPEQKADLEYAFQGAIKSTKSADYVSGWFIKARRFIAKYEGAFAFVTTNSICQGRQVSLFWPAFLGDDLEIYFAEPSFTWSNLASKNAAVTVSIIGITKRTNSPKKLYDGEHVIAASYIGPYLVPDHDTIVSPSRKLLSALTPMTNGSMPNDNGGLLLSTDEYRRLVSEYPLAARFCRKFLGSGDSIKGEMRYCLWILDNELSEAVKIPEILRRIEVVKEHRQKSDRPGTNALAEISHAFGERRHRDGTALLIPRHSSEKRPYLPSVIVDETTVVGDSALAMYDLRLMDFALYSSRLHRVWTATVCGKIKEDYRYSNTLGWNTFPVPELTEKNKVDLAQSAEDILLVRETYFPASIADLYDSETMPDDLRHAHDRNDEILERIYVGRRFKNDTERLKKLFELYSIMVANQRPVKKRK